MRNWLKLKLIFVLLLAVSSTGCALAAIDYALGDKKATHADDQSADSSGNQGNIYSQSNTAE
jgi:hypothetical protein